MSERFADDVFEEPVRADGEYDSLAELGTTRVVDPRKVDCEKLDRSFPIFKAIGTTDPVGVLETVCLRALAMLDNTIAELTRIRQRVRAGDPPAFPLIGDLLGWSLQTRMMMRASDPRAWTGTGPRTADQILRWLTNIRNLIASRDLWYTCLASGCSETTRAFVIPGHFRIHLCRRFWRPRPGINAATHLEFQAQTIIHEVSHIYYDTKDVGRGPGSAHCIAQFIADANGSPIRRQIIGRCGPGGPTPHRETEEEFLGDRLQAEGPAQWPQWPPSRSFNPPPPQTIPTGPFRTFSPCDAIIDDTARLSLAVDDLQNQLRQRPSNPGRVNNRSDIVTALSRQIVARLQNLSYLKQRCTREDLKLFASAVNTMRGGGADADTGSWPPAGSPREQGPRRSARESLRHLLAWIRRADRNFPRI
jgi:Lysine-specific metallo-endopeptidase